MLNEFEMVVLEKMKYAKNGRQENARNVLEFTNVEPTTEIGTRKTLRNSRHISSFVFSPFSLMTLKAVISVQSCTNLSRKRLFREFQSTDNCKNWSNYFARISVNFQNARIFRNLPSYYPPRFQLEFPQNLYTLSII